MQQFQIFVSDDQKVRYLDALGDLVPAIWEDDAGQLIGICDESEESFRRLAAPVLQAYDLNFPEIQFFDMENRDWLKENQSRLPPLDLGRFFISNAEKKEGKVQIALDATSAFGSGHHDTTAGCVKALDRLEKEFFPKNALDVGTGSGILAICIEKLWKIQVIACDNNPHCVQAARKNISLNGCQNILALESDGLAHTIIQENKPYDLIVANIITNPLCALAGQIADALGKKGLFLCSGVLKEQVETLKNAYHAHGLELRDAVEEGDFVVCQFTKTAL